MMLVIIQMLLFLMPILMSVAFLTLVERKILGYSQFRKGPNMVGPYGLLQPFADALKLFIKENMKPYSASPMMFFFSPFLFIFLALMLWEIIPTPYNIMKTNIKILLILGMSSLAVYPMLGAGWASKSKYSLIGGMRAMAQMMSYEMSLGLIIMSILLWINSFSLKDMKNMWIFMPLFPLLCMWLMSTLAETKRAPFDLTEGESELVSGFKVEYAGGPFALFFIAEYANIIFMKLLSVSLFFGGSGPLTKMPIIKSMTMAMKTILLIFWFVWVRASYPRFRYDQLMHLTWKKYLPFSMGILCLSLSIIILTKSSIPKF